MNGSPAMNFSRIALVGLGLGLLLIGAVQLLTQVPPARYPGIAVWLLGALIIHDGIIAIAVLGASILVRRLRLPVPFVVIVVVQGAVVVAGIVTILVLPEIVKKSIGSANPSILPLDYLGGLGLFYAGLTLVTGAVVGVVLMLRRLRARSPRTT